MASTSRWGRLRASIGLFVFIWFCVHIVESLKSEIIVSMGNTDLCNLVGEKIMWVSEDTSAIITGKTESEQLQKECTVRFGVASKNPTARLMLKFEYIYIHDCGVSLQINESLTSNFIDNTNHEIFMSHCNIINPERLFSRPKHYLLIHLSKNTDLLRYNFYLNVSLSEFVPVSGPPLHTVIIVGFVLGVVTITVFYLLMKYVFRLTDDWREQQREEAMTRAISIYNSHDHSQDREPDLVYITPVTQQQQHCNQNEGSGSGSSHGSRGRRQSSEIAFVHPNGRIERFATYSPTTERKRQLGMTVAIKKHPVPVQSAIMDEAGPSTSAQASRSHIQTHPALCVDLDSGSVASSKRDVQELDGTCDVPPSYEEALCMPVLGAEAGVEDEGEEGLEEQASGTISHVGEGGRLELNYINVGSGQELENDAEDETHDCVTSLINPQKPRLKKS